MPVGRSSMNSSASCRGRSFGGKSRCRQLPIKSVPYVPFFLVKQATGSSPALRLGINIAPTSVRLIWLIIVHASRIVVATKPCRVRRVQILYVGKRPCWCRPRPASPCVWRVNRRIRYRSDLACFQYTQHNGTVRQTAPDSAGFRASKVWGLLIDPTCKR